LERAALEEAIGEWACGGIHHIGSTSVPDLDAKPIIDILAAIPPDSAFVFPSLRAIALGVCGVLADFSRQWCRQNGWPP
jgi:GrpB-like predicted nucleotidyltransferase (UPF0157 family)